MKEPIPLKMLERARRSTARRIAAALVTCMADTDASFESIAKRIGQPQDTVRGWLYSWVDGTSGNGFDLEQMSDFALAMGAELRPQVRPCEFMNEPEPKEAVAA